jgi:hypothetical protein
MALDRRVVQSAREQCFMGWTRKLTRRAPADEHTPTIGKGVNLDNRTALDIQCGVCGIGRVDDDRQTGTVKDSRDLNGEVLPGGKYVSSGFLGYFHEDKYLLRRSRPGCSSTPCSSSTLCSSIQNGRSGTLVQLERIGTAATRAANAVVTCDSWHRGSNPTPSASPRFSPTDLGLFFFQGGSPPGNATFTSPACRIGPAAFVALVSSRPPGAA